MTEILPGLAPLVDRFDLFIVDLWGVLHDGARPYPGAIDALRRLNAAGRTVVLLSNAPRQARFAESRLRALGFPAGLWDFTLTSGEIVWQHFASRRDPWYAALGHRTFMIGHWDKDGAMLDGNGLVAVHDLAEAELILNCGVDFGQTLDDVAEDLARGVALGLPMVCANPDLEVIHHGRREICAGLIAEAYAQRGGEMRMHGKPLPEMYEIIRARYPHIPAARIIGIGDSLRTDIAGAQGAGLAAALVTGGIHAETLGVTTGVMPDQAALTELFATYARVPDITLAGFAW